MSLGKIDWKADADAPTNASKALPALMTEFFAEVRRVLATDPPPADLHAIRLAAKKVRYTLELFRSCYGPGLKQRMDAMKQLQNVLGEVNDSVATERLIRRMAPKSPARNRVMSFLQHRSENKAAALRKEWTEVFDAPGREAWWVEYLANNTKKS